jgi:hypothetical protein
MKFENQRTAIIPVQESTYALLVRSEEKQRTVFEAVVYALFIVSAVAAIWQFAQQPVTLPVHGVLQSASVTPKVVTVRS